MITKSWSEAARDAVISGGAAGVASTAALALRGRRENGSAYAPINAPSHVLYGDRALMKNAATWRYTGAGGAIQLGSAWFWGVLHERLHGHVAERGLGAALAAAACTTALAAVVDLVVVPKRLTPGWERRLSPRSVALVYGAFGLGLALGSRWLALSAKALARSRRS
jgi:hypothetical protein